MARIGTVRKHSEEFKRRAVERMNTADSITELAHELGVPRALLYKWEAQQKGRPKAAKVAEEKPPATDTERALREENKQLREALGKRSLEVDFFRGALQKIEARRRSASSGVTASTTKSGK